MDVNGDLMVCFQSCGQLPLNLWNCCSLHVFFKDLVSVATVGFIMNSFSSWIIISTFTQNMLNSSSEKHFYKAEQ